MVHGDYCAYAGHFPCFPTTDCVLLLYQFFLVKTTKNHALSALTVCLVYVAQKNAARQA